MVIGLQWIVGDRKRIAQPQDAEGARGFVKTGFIQISLVLIIAEVAKDTIIYVQKRW